MNYIPKWFEEGLLANRIMIEERLKKLNEERLEELKQKIKELEAGVYRKRKVFVCGDTVVEGVSEMDIPIFELTDGYDVVRVKPCRRCYERLGETIKPKFYWFDDPINYVNMYRIYCPACGERIMDSGMVSEFDPKDAEKRWNDWSQKLRDWEDNLDW